VNLPPSEHFGNPLIRGIAEIHIPDPVPWTPSAPGWILLFAILMATGLGLFFRLWKRWKGNAYRRRALNILKRLKQTDGRAEQTVLLPGLLKSTALQAFPRALVASLYGEKWIAFLESRYAEPGFRENAGKHLLTISYRNPETWNLSGDQIEAVFSFAGRWIKHHRREDEPL
jgi:hypothetical protein